MPGVIKDPCDEGVMLARDGAGKSASGKGRWILAATILASSMAFIDGTVVNVALPALQKDLHATAIGVQWVVEAYALFLSALLLAGGSFGDRYGRRRVFLIGVTIFALASIWCGLAPNIGQLIAARALQGIGGALLVPGSLAIISASFPSAERGRAIGTWSGFSAITTAIGPVLGGWLIENVSWRAIFFLNIPLAVAIVLISIRHIPETRALTKHGPIDWLGALLATVGLAGLTFGLIESSRLTLFALPVLASVGVGLVALVAFVYVEAHKQSPMLPLGLFRSRNFAGANLLTLLLYFALGVVMFFLTLNLIQVQGFSATAGGAALLPFVIIMFALSRWSGGLIARYGPRPPLIVGPIITAMGHALLALPGVGAGYWIGYFPGVAVLGIGMAISVAPLTTTVMSSVREEEAGVASGVNNAVSRAAGLLAIAVLGVVMLQVFSRELQQRLNSIDMPVVTRAAIYDQRIKLAGLEVPKDLDSAKQAAVERAVKESFVAGFRLIMIIAALMALGSALVAALMIENKKP